MPENWTLTVDLSELEQQVASLQNVDLAPLTQAVRDAAEYVRQVWGSAVQGNLLPGMTRPVEDDDYYESLYTGEALRMITPLHGAVVCLYDKIDRIEDGYPSFDQKPGLINGPSSRQAKDGGRYNIVPFRHMTPTGKNKPGSDPRRHGATMPESVYKIVKATGTFKDPGNRRLGEQIGQRSKVAGAINIEALARGMPPVMATNYTWKYGLYHGMKRIVKTYEKATQSTYYTWRAVSSNSDPSSWIHPGLSGNGVIAAVIEASREQVTQIVMAGARQAFGLVDSSG